MARLPWRRRDTTTVVAEQADTVKAAPPLPPGTVAVDASQLIAALQAGAQQVTAAAPLPQWDPRVPFGPGLPIRPSAIDPLRPDSNRPEPRLYEYQVSANLPGSGQRLLPWKVLRDAADSVGLVRRCIEIRKAHIANAEWAVRPSKAAMTRAIADAGDGTDRKSVEQEMRAKLAPAIAAAEDFMRVPDRGNGLPFGDWLGSLLEEHFVLDAIAIYPRRTRGGDLFSLEIIDGSTIKPLLDHRGARPLPPSPAYQQILHGFPRGEFVASVETIADGTGGTVSAIPGAYRSDELVYRRRNVRSWTPYGFSSVEQSLVDAETWLRRIGWVKSEYTDGVMPSGWLKVLDGTAAAAWTPAQVVEYETVLNDFLSGNTTARHRFKILPPGLEPDDRTDVADKYKPDYDLFLLKLVASHFDVTPAELGFMESGGLGGASYHEGQEDVQDRKGTRPLESWIQEVISELLHVQLGVPAELEFAFLGEESEDEAAADEVADARIKRGGSTLNEDRDRQGVARYNFPEADIPFIVTASGPVFLDGLIEKQQQEADAAAEAEKVKAAALAAGPAAGAPGADPAKPKPAAKTAKPAADADSKKADELAAFRRYLVNGKTRPFVAEHISKAEATAAGLPADRMVCKSAGDAGARDDAPTGGLDGVGGAQGRGATLHLPYQPGC